ncbi:hypothetical protein ABZP36_031846 [Zizania latifolia]
MAGSIWRSEAISEQCTLVVAGHYYMYYPVGVLFSREEPWRERDFSLPEGPCVAGLHRRHGGGGGRRRHGEFDAVLPIRGNVFPGSTAMKQTLPVISRFCKVSLCRVPVFVSCYWPHKLCHNLMKLLLKNAWLSVDGLRIMPNLTHLTLEFIRLDDEDLSNLNECFPCLQILNLIGVGGLKDLNIDLHQLKICHWKIPISTNSYELFEAVKPEYLLQLFIGINEAKLASRFSREMMHFLD